MDGRAQSSRGRQSGHGDSGCSGAVWQRAPLSQAGAGRERGSGRFSGPED